MIPGWASGIQPSISLLASALIHVAVIAGIATWVSVDTSRLENSIAVDLVTAKTAAQGRQFRPLPAVVRPLRGGGPSSPSQAKLMASGRSDWAPPPPSPARAAPAYRLQSIRRLEAQRSRTQPASLKTTARVEKKSTPPKAVRRAHRSAAVKTARTQSPAQLVEKKMPSPAQPKPLGGGQNKVGRQAIFQTGAHIAGSAKTATADRAFSSPGPARMRLRPAHGNPKPHYPRLARRRGWQGEVLLAVTVNSNGQVRFISVKKSSGFTILDRSALETVQGWRFITLAKPRQAARIEVPVVFQLTK